MSHGRAVRILMRWERYHHRHPKSGAYQIGPERYHTAHLKANTRAQDVGRAFPRGIRLDPWKLRERTGT